MGSVRAARERMELDMGESRYSEEQTESSQPAWPLASNASNQYPQIHGTAPQRPPRPNYIPSGLSEHGIVDHAQLQSQQYSRGEIQQQTKYWEPNYGTPGSITPGTTSSRDSAGSSVGSIPDFPIPAVPVNASQSGPKRAQNVGPPPIQRRGPSYYYSQSSYVAPIPEENIDMPQHAGYPPRRIEVPSQAWQNSAQDFYIDRSPSLSTPGDHLVESAGLLGNASTGNQHKPSLTTARPAINTLLPQKGLVASKPIVIDHTHLAAEHTVFVESMDSDDEDTSLRGRDSMEGTTFLRETSADSDLHAGGFLGEKDMIVSLTASRDHSPRRQDPRVEHLMVGLEKGGAIPIGTAPPIVEVETRAKPAAFDFTSEASNRASLTSLTDLIKRATKVKTNLEKGRTASRLGLLDFFTPSKPDLLKVTKGKSIAIVFIGEEI